MSKLDKIRLNHSPLTDSIFAGILNKKGTLFLDKVDITDDFIQCVISRWEDHTETITNGTEEWEITIKKIKT